MRDSNGGGAAPDFTVACIVMFGVNLSWVLMLVWVIWGLIGAGVTGWLVNRALIRIENARG